MTGPTMVPTIRQIFDGSQTQTGKQYAWYYGGILVKQSHTVTSGDVSAGYIALTTGTIGEHGTVVLRVNGVVTFAKQFSDALGVTAATDATGVKSIKYTSPTAGDVLDIRYLDVGTTPLTQVAFSEDVKIDPKADTKKIAVNGQGSKVYVSTTVENSGEIKALWMDQILLAAILGDRVTDGASKTATWTNTFNTFNKLAAFVGKRYDSSENVIEKRALLGCTFESVSIDSKPDDASTQDMKFLVDSFVFTDFNTA